MKKSILFKSLSVILAVIMISGFVFTPEIRVKADEIPIESNEEIVEETDSTDETGPINEMESTDSVELDINENTTDITVTEQEEIPDTVDDITIEEGTTEYVESDTTDNTTSIIPETLPDQTGQINNQDAKQSEPIEDETPEVNENIRVESLSSRAIDMVGSFGYHYNLTVEGGEGVVYISGMVYDPNDESKWIPLELWLNGDNYYNFASRGKTEFMCALSVVERGDVIASIRAYDDNGNPGLYKNTGTPFPITISKIPCKITYPVSSIDIAEGETQDVTVRFRGDGIYSLQTVSLDGSIATVQSYSGLDYSTGTVTFRYAGISAGSTSIYMHLLNENGEVLLSEPLTVNVYKKVTNQLPTGNIGSCKGGNGYININGYAYDPDNMNAKVTVKMCIGGPEGSAEEEYYFTADGPTNNNGYHGFAEADGSQRKIFVNARGARTVYVYAIDVQTGESVLFGNYDVTINSTPFSITYPSSLFNIAIRESEEFTFEFKGEGIYTLGTHTDNPAGASLEITSVNYATGTASARISTGNVKGKTKVYVTLLDSSNNILYEKPITVDAITSLDGGIGNCDGGEGKIILSGWAWDENYLNDHLTLDIYVAEVGASEGSVYHATANGATANHGDHGITTADGNKLSVNVNESGEKDIYIFAVSSRYPDKPILLLNKKTITIGAKPLGVVGSIDGGAGCVILSGWAWDPDDTVNLFVPINVYVGGDKNTGTKYSFIANGQTSSHGNHGINDVNGGKRSVPVKETGSQEVYVYAVSPQDSTVDDILLAHETITISATEIKPTSIKLDKTSETVPVGSTFSLKATVEPSNATNKTVTWKSSNTSVATVDENGNVKAIAAGTAKIIATANAASTVSATLSLTVVPKPTITADSSSYTLKAGEVSNITFTYTGDLAADAKTVIAGEETAMTAFASATTIDTSAKTVSVVICGLREGSTTLTLKLLNSAGTEIASKTVNIIVRESAYSITFPSSPILVAANKTQSYNISFIGRGVYAVKGSLNNANSSLVNTDLNYEFDYTNKVGTITAEVKGGSTVDRTSVFTVSLIDKFGQELYSKNVTVKVVSSLTLIEKITLNASANQMTVGDTLKLTPAITPSNATNTTLSWKSSDTSIATVSNTGIVTAKNAGQATITATATDGSNIAGSYSIEVINVKLTPSQSSYTVKAGERIAVPFTYTGRNTVVKATGSSADANIVFAGDTILNTGTDTLTAYLTGLRRGKTAYTVQLINSAGKVLATSSITITVSGNAYEITIPYYPIEIEQGGERAFSISFSGRGVYGVSGSMSTADATLKNKNFEWSFDTNTGKGTASCVIQAGNTAGKSSVLSINLLDNKGNSLYSQEVIVYITEPTVHITLNKTSLELNVGSSERLIATITPASVTNKKIDWTTSNAAVATVDANGNVKAIAKGTATITAATVDGNKIAFCNVTVIGGSNVTPAPSTPSSPPKNGWYRIDGKEYWYENGVRQGTVGRGKEIYDPGSNAWYWLDAVQGGAKAVGKDVYQESKAGKWAGHADGTGKWVRYDANGHMIKGWQTTGGNTYYFDFTYGTMAKGYATIDGTEYYFDPVTGILQKNLGSVPKMGWKNINGKDYWYENYDRQGISVDSSYRGKEIYFSGQAGIANPSHLPAGWYWLDNVYDGAKAANKEVYMPYTINGQDNIGKWVRYDGTGQMIKGWYDLNGKRYYYNLITGAMLKGTQVIDGRTYHFDETTGVLK